MGKNQAYKAMQRAKMSSTPANGGPEDVEDGMMDGSFHSPEWHAARLASLSTSHTITWEEYKKRQKEEARRKEELEDDEARSMREYRAQLDAERASKLARGKNHADKKASKGSKERGQKRKGHERRHRNKSDTESDSEISSDNDKRGLFRKERQKSRRDRQEKRHKSRRKLSSGDILNSGKEYGPVPLSSFFEKGNC